MIQYILFSIISVLSVGSYLISYVKKDHNKRINEMINHHLEISKDIEDKQELKDELKTLSELHKLIL